MDSFSLSKVSYIAFHEKKSEINIDPYAGGRIDHAHHANQPLRALWETIEFDKAIKLGDDMTDDTNTTIVVTADHAHVMSIAGECIFIVSAIRLTLLSSFIILNCIKIKL